MLLEDAGLSLGIATGGYPEAECSARDQSKGSGGRVLGKHCSPDVDAPVVQGDPPKDQADGLHRCNRVVFLEAEHIRYRHDLGVIVHEKEAE
jgi:hypothetical protein